MSGSGGVRKQVDVAALPAPTRMTLRDVCAGLDCRSAAVFCRAEACYPSSKYRRDRAVNRRQLVTLLGGAAAAWPLAAQAQEPERVRRIGVLLATAADDAEAQTRVGAFLQGLALLGWIDGRNVRIDTRWATTNPDELRRHAMELAALTPDV